MPDTMLQSDMQLGVAIKYPLIWKSYNMPYNGDDREHLRLTGDGRIDLSMERGIGDE